MEAYCMKCKAKREMQAAEQITMKNGRPATQGKCPVCGTKMFKIGKSWSDSVLRKKARIYGPFFVKNNYKNEKK